MYCSRFTRTRNARDICSYNYVTMTKKFNESLQIQLPLPSSNSSHRRQPDKPLTVGQRHSCSVVSGADSASNEYLPVPRDAVSPLSRPHKVTTRSKERFEAPSEIVLQVLVATPPETTVGSKWDTAGDVSRRNSRLDILQHVPYPLEVSALPNPEPTVSLRAWPSCLTCPPDTLLEEDVISKRPATSYPSLPQKPGSRPLLSSLLSHGSDSVAALVRARLAARSACDEFDLWLPKYPPNELLGMDKRHSSDVVNKTNRTSTNHSPSSTGALSLPKT